MKKKKKTLKMLASPQKHNDSILLSNTNVSITSKETARTKDLYLCPVSLNLTFLKISQTL